MSLGHSLPLMNQSDINTSNPTLPDGIQDVPGINVAEGLKRIKGDEKLYLTMLSDFNKQFANSVEEINLAIAHHNFENGMILVHTISGVAANLGANELNLKAIAIETAIRKQKINDVTELLPTFIDAFQTVVTSIKALQLTQKKRPGIKRDKPLTSDLTQFKALST